MGLLSALIQASSRGAGSRPQEDRAADREALERIARGDAEALAALYGRHARFVYSIAIRIAADPAEAEDVVQEVFTQVWRQAARYDVRRGPVAAWILTIARSRAIDRLRARRARPEAAPRADRDLDPPDPAGAQDLAVMTEEQIARVRAALADLPLLQRLAIELAYYEGLSQSEIAERLEQPLGTIKTRIRLGLLKLREALAGAER